jgi:uncharacterized protein
MSEMHGDADRRRPISAGSVVKIGLIVYVLAALLNSSNLQQMAVRLPYGSPIKKQAMSLTKTLHSMSSALHLTEPGVRVDAYRGIAPPTTAGEGGAFGPAPTSVAPDVPTVTEPGATVASADTTAPPEPAATTPPETAVRVPTAADPVRLYIGGDSLVQGWGSVLQRLAVATRLVDARSVDYKPATGLSRPDSYDWPSRLVNQMNASRPQIVIVGFGGNDAQGLLIGGKPFQPGSPEWRDEYASRVAATMDYLLRDRRKVIWVGTPMPRDATDFARQEIINQIYRDETAKRPGVTFVDTWVLFESPEHTYADYLIDDDGQAKLMRQTDGFHLSVAGAERLGRSVFGELQKELAARGATNG